MSTLRSWDLVSCMRVEGGDLGGLVKVLAVEGLLGRQMLRTMGRLEMTA